jgi:PPOX class probable FMN-dependent enzyme
VTGLEGTMTVFRATVTTEAELRTLIGGEPSALALAKEQRTLDGHCRSFIARSPFVLVATAGATGRCDVSPKGDAPGFVLVLDERRLLIPDRPGNKRLDGMRNLLDNPHVGLIFLIPGVEETLRVNGRGVIVRDPDLLARCEVRGKVPALGIGVEVEEAFIHCAKAFKRSGLWEPARWPALDGLASPAQMLFDHTRPPGTTVEELDRVLQDGYRQRLY